MRSEARRRESKEWIVLEAGEREGEQEDLRPRAGLRQGERSRHCLPRWHQRQFHQLVLASIQAAEGEKRALNIISRDEMSSEPAACNKRSAEE